MLSTKTKRELKIDQRQILIDSIEIGIPSPQQILTWGERVLPNGKRVGCLKNSKTVNYKRFTPFRDGLFCERIFGPITSFVCACGKKQPHSKTSFCEKCEVEYIDQRSRRYRLGYISLLAPVTHIWYLKGRPSYLSLFLGKRKKTVVALAYCNAYLIEHSISKKNDNVKNDQLVSYIKSFSNAEHFLQSKTSKNFYPGKVENNYSQNTFFQELPCRNAKLCTTHQKLLAKNLFFPEKANFASPTSSVCGAKQSFTTLLRHFRCLYQFKSEKTTRFISYKKRTKKKPYVLQSKYLHDSLHLAIVWRYKVKFNATKSGIKDASKCVRRNIEARRLLCSKFARRVKVTHNTQGTYEYKSCERVSISKPKQISFYYSFRKKIQKNCTITEDRRFDSKLSKKFLTQNLIEKDPFLLTSYGTYFYARRHTLPFLPNLVSHFYLRDALLNFTYSVATHDDFPLLEYCHIKRWEPLRDVHKFMAHKTVDNFKNDFSYDVTRFTKNFSKESETFKGLRGYKTFSFTGSTSNFSYNSVSSVVCVPFTQRTNLGLGQSKQFLTRFPEGDQNIAGRKYISKSSFASRSKYCFLSSAKNRKDYNLKPKVTFLSKGSRKFSSRKNYKEFFNTAKKNRTKNSFFETEKKISLNEEGTRSALSGLELTAITEILSYTGGGALQQLLQQFNQHDLCKFLFAETQILRVLYETHTLYCFANALEAEKKIPLSLSQGSEVTNRTVKQSFVRATKISDFSYKNDRLYRSSSFIRKKSVTPCSKTKFWPTESFAREKPRTPGSTTFNTHKICAQNQISEQLRQLQSKSSRHTYFFGEQSFGFGVVKKVCKTLPKINQKFQNQAFQSCTRNKTRGFFRRNFVTVFPERNEKKIVSDLVQRSTPLKNCQKKDDSKKSFYDDFQSKTPDLQKKQILRISRRIYKIARRLKIAQLLTRNHRKPEWMILSHLPVLPPDLRPILQMSEKVIVASDLNIMYQRVIYRNNRHLRVRFIDFHLVTAIQRLVQDAVDRLIENGKGGSKPYYTQGGRPLKSLSDILKGKKGRFRLNLLGKRVDFSGRSVIVVSPLCQIHECGLPKDIALELYHYFLLRQLIVKKYCASIVTAKKMVKSKSSLMWDILRELMYHHPVLLNRAPTLHRLGIQAFQPKLVLGNAILLHPLVCSGFNADFDGDQMGVHLPLSFAARAESWDLLWSRNNLLSPATGQPMLVPSQDMVLGFYYMSAQASQNVSVHSQGTRKPYVRNQNENTVFKNPKLLNKRDKDDAETEKIKNTFFRSDSKRDSFFASGEKKDTFSVFERSGWQKTNLFLNVKEIMTRLQTGKLNLHHPVWLYWTGKVENEEGSQKPLEVRVHSFGLQQSVYEKYVSSNVSTKISALLQNNVQLNNNLSNQIENKNRSLRVSTKAGFYSSFLHIEQDLLFNEKEEELPCKNFSNTNLYKAKLRHSFMISTKSESYCVRTTAGRVLINNLIKS